MAQRKKSGRIYSAILASVFAIGMSPFVFNWVVDPYDMNGVVDLDLKKFKISEQAHYPLWKMIHFPKEGAETVILGDSRARALREKIWHSLGVDAFNFAYGGATIDEIFDTFEHIKSNPALKTLIVSLPLRSFDPNHRKGLNRVPEAIRLSQNPVAYYKSWFVSKIGWRNLDHRYPAYIDFLRSLQPGSLVSKAKAQTIVKSNVQNAGGRYDDLGVLLDQDACRSCQLPSNVASAPHPSAARLVTLGLGRGYGGWSRLWTPITLQRDLPGKFERQVRKNGANDWAKFKFSETLWSKIETIAHWCKNKNIQLVFVIPPTIAEMQKRMAGFGFVDLNHRFRLRLAELAPVFDFDFNSSLTRDLSKFTDAYHFKSKSAHAIVGEIVQMVASQKKPRARAFKRRKEIICPIHAKDVRKDFSDGIVRVQEGQSCRIWRWNNG